MKISESERIKIKKELCLAVELRDLGQLMVAEQILQKKSRDFCQWLIGTTRKPKKLLWKIT